MPVCSPALLHRPAVRIQAPSTVHSKTQAGTAWVLIHTHTISSK
jgi:hypothetical protein